MAGKTRLPFNQKPLLLNNGVVTLQLGSGKATSLLLDSHSFLQMDETGNTVVVCLLVHVVFVVLTNVFYNQCVVYLCLSVQKN